MKITNLDFLYVGTIEENFRILIYAYDKNEAKAALKSYAKDTNMNTSYLHIEKLSFVASWYGGVENIPFDCDVVISKRDTTSAIHNHTIEEMNLSVRTYNCLVRAGYKTLNDFRSKTKNDLMQVRNLGRRSLTEIVDKCAELGVIIPTEG